MKAYTDLNQSKKLAEILPLESADMCWTNHCYGIIRSSMTVSSKTIEEYKELLTRFCDLTNIDVFYPCWSLAALLEQLDDEITDEDGNDYNLTILKEDFQYQLYYHDSWGQVEDIETDYYDDLVDACYEMIIKLHEQKLL